MTYNPLQKLTAEALGTTFLLAIVVGSGIMGDALADGNDAIALLGNTIATGAGLYVLILIFGPVSGAHFNPAVTLTFLLRKEIAVGMAVAYIAAQVAGGVIGVWIAHAMFDLDILQRSVKARDGAGQMIGEAVATFGLVLTILGAVRFRPESVASAVGLYITAGYWFTSSTSFANPAVTIARTLTDTFAGVRLADAPGFVLAQCLAAAFATAVAFVMFGPRDAESAARYRRSHDEGSEAAL
jgi:glycerol uptake facilitator-like aquaporin